MKEEGILYCLALQETNFLEFDIHIENHFKHGITQKVKDTVFFISSFYWCGKNKRDIMS